MNKPAKAKHWSNVGCTVKQSGPVDLTNDYDAANIGHKTIIITGGASGIGAACARTWAGLGAFVVIGDINEEAGGSLERELGAALFVRCDVTRWADVWDLFKAAAAASPTAGIHAVMMCAGIMEVDGTITGKGFENPIQFGEPMPVPPPPALDVAAVNLFGVMNVVHSALHWLPRNGGPSSMDHDGVPLSGPVPRDSCAALAADRHILFVGSLASVSPMPGQPLYTASKHGVMGLFRSLRGTSYLKGIRCNLVAPYLVDTPLVPTKGMAMAAGVPKADMADVVDAASRLMADHSIRGRALMIGPKLPLGRGRGRASGCSSAADGEVQVEIEHEHEHESEQAAWDMYAHDYEAVELFVRRYITALNALAELRSWVQFLVDLFRLFMRAAWHNRPQSQKPRTLVENEDDNDDNNDDDDDDEEPVVRPASASLKHRVLMKMG